MTTHAFIGSPCTASKAGAFTFGHWVSHGAQSVEPHGHAEAHFMYVPMGDFETCASGERARDGSYLVYNPRGTWHADRRIDPGPFFSITIAGDIDVGDDRLPGAPTSLTAPAQHTIVRKLMRACTNGGDGYSEALAFELLGATSAPSVCEHKEPRWLKRVVELIECSTERDISIAAIAHDVDVHPVHVARTFRAFYGCTPAEYLRTRRCHRAARLLSTTRCPLAEVALMAGFADQSHFTKAFGLVTGTTPAAYRRMTAN